MAKKIVIKIIRLYQSISFDHGFLGRLTGKKVCRFHPTCSDYCIESVEKYGVLRGLRLGVGRILRCNPFFEGGVDLVK